MTALSPHQEKCPRCGATVTFKLATSRLSVCRCKAVVSRAGQDDEVLGQADLVQTGSPIALGQRGLFERISFEVLGRLQYAWQSGVWDEWYLAFADGRCGWLAETQDGFYLTFKIPLWQLPQGEITPGADLLLEGVGHFLVSEVIRAKLVGLAGELPAPARLGETNLSADLKNEQGAFATLSFGVEGGASALYLGQQVPFEALHLGGAAAAPRERAEGPAGEQSQCPHCGEAVRPLLPRRAVHLVCPRCKRLLDLRQTPFRVVASIAGGGHTPCIALGSEGRLRGTARRVVGWMVRSCDVDGIRYHWDEYLLWSEGQQSFAWLVEADGHWQLACAIAEAAVSLDENADYEGRRFLHFSSVKGVVELLHGEFYWPVRPGEAAQLDDFIAPPEGLSRELANGEVNWSHLAHLSPEELAQAFNQPDLAQRERRGVGEIQPWPFETTWKRLRTSMLVGLAGLACLWALFAHRPEPTYLEQDFDSTTPPRSEAGLALAQQSFLSRPFNVPPHRALRVEFSSDVYQSWAYVDGALINDASGEALSFGLESSYYSGIDSDGSWREGSRVSTQALRALGAGGKTLVRADLKWDPTSVLPPKMRLRVVGDAYSAWQFCTVLVLLCWPLLLLLFRVSFERARWDESNCHEG